MTVRPIQKSAGLTEVKGQQNSPYGCQKVGRSSTTVPLLTDCGSNIEIYLTKWPKVDI